MRCTKSDRYEVGMATAQQRSQLAPKAAGLARVRSASRASHAPRPELLARALELGLFEIGFGSNRRALGVARAISASAAISTQLMG